MYIQRVYSWKKSKQGFQLGLRNEEKFTQLFMKLEEICENIMHSLGKLQINV